MTPARPTDPNSLSLPALFDHLASTGLVDRLIALARDEDLGAAGDITSRVCLPDDRPDRPARAALVARSAATIAGLAAGPRLVRAFAPSATLTLHHADGDTVPARTTLATLSGPWRELLALERTLLNLVGRLSGIATLTAQYAARLPQPCRARIFDTRKTTPGLRVFEKYAVRCGGGRCHRLGLHDAVLIKDNHIAGITPANLPKVIADAAARARRDFAPAFIEVEVDTLDQFEALLTLPEGTIDIVLLDNMGPATLRQAAARRDAVRPALELEASGGITLDTLRDAASTGVDRISIGALTHHAVSADVALDVLA